MIDFLLSDGFQTYLICGIACALISNISFDLFVYRPMLAEARESDSEEHYASTERKLARVQKYHFFLSFAFIPMFPLSIIICTCATLATGVWPLKTARAFIEELDENFTWQEFMDGPN